MEFKAPGVYVLEEKSQIQPISGVGTSTAGFIGLVETKAKTDADQSIAPASKPVLITNWQDFTRNFGKDLIKDKNALAHAINGFFQNGGTRCYVARVNSLKVVKSNGEDKDEVKDALHEFEAIDEIAIIAVPMPTIDDTERKKAIIQQIISHCKNMKDRFAILDGEQKNGKPEEVTPAAIYPYDIKSSFAAVYYPFLEVEKDLFMPPSGHVAGIYSRVDSDRGVYKAPANEVIRGIIGLKHNISKSELGELNAGGVNVIRQFRVSDDASSSFDKGKCKVWGARTISDDNEPGFEFVNVRRTMLYLRESIDEGTQWAVFEPNNLNLWQNIKRNITDFLTVQWHMGALVGNTRDEAFFVKCDKDTNPEDEVKQGRVNALVGVSIVRPAEFILIRISQSTASI